MQDVEISPFLSLERCESLSLEYMQEVCRLNPDPSHDMLHVQRVVHNAKELCLQEKGSLEVVVPAAYLHDCVYVSKSSPERALASKLSADKAVGLLKSWNYDKAHFDAIHHAIHAHSFSANVPTQSLEAKIVQDADRLDALGAIGIVRCFAHSGLVKGQFYNQIDPNCREREPEDHIYAIDHFYKKLLKLKDTFQTKSALLEANRRTEFMHQFVQKFYLEIGAKV